VATDAREVVLRLPADESPPVGSGEGRVVDEEGRPIPRFDAQLSGPAGYHFAPRGRDATDGRFRIDGVPAGTWTLRVWTEGFVPWIGKGLEVRAGDPLPRFEVVLSRGATVVGRLREASGLEWKGFVVSLVAFDPDLRSEAGFSARVESDGSFRLPGLRPAAYRVTVFRGADAGAGPAVSLMPATEEQCVVPEGAKEVPFEATLALAGTLSVSVQDGRFAEAFGSASGDDDRRRFSQDSRVRVLNAAGAVVSDRSGVFRGFSELVALLPGDYVVRLVTPDGTHEEQPARIEAGKDASVDFCGE